MLDVAVVDAVEPLANADPPTEVPIYQLYPVAKLAVVHSKVNPVVEMVENPTAVDPGISYPDE